MNETRGLWRGKRLDNGEWVKGVPLQHCEGDWQIISGKVGAMIIDTVAPSTLGECTGLTDNNGKLIFEGDIVEIKGNIGRVIFVDDEAGFVIDTDEKYFTMSFSSECEAIGNIHDNPELLKGENQ